MYTTILDLMLCMFVAFSVIIYAINTFNFFYICDCLHLTSRATESGTSVMPYDWGHHLKNFMSKIFG
jgi:hypothetical protein